MDSDLFSSPTLNKYRREFEERAIKENTIRKEILRQKGLKELFIFNKYVLEVEKGDNSFVPLTLFHKELCNFVTDKSDRKKLILIPRAHLKSKLITIGYSLFRIFNNPKVRILIYSATWSMAVSLNMAIQKNLQGNETLIDIFGDLSKGATEWSQDKTRLKENTSRDSTVTAAGIDNNLVGGHYDLIIMDDVVSRDNVTTRDQIMKVIQRYKDSLDLLEPNGQLLLVGTRWDDADLYGWIQDPRNDILSSFDVMIKQAYDGNIMTGEGFEALWPEKFTLQELQKRLREEGWSHFSAQYLNNPVPEEDATFKRTWFSYFDPSEMKGKLLNKFMAIDPASDPNMSLHAAGLDYTGMVVVGQDDSGYLYVLDIVRARMSPNDIINEMFRMREKWGLTDIGIEQVSFQKMIAYSLRQDERFKKHPFHISELKPNERTKEYRIKGLQPLYENGKILHDRNHPNTLYLEDELVRFPKAPHDDVSDALSYTLDFIYH